MTNTEAHKILVLYNRWRRGGSSFSKMDTARIGKAIEIAIAALAPKKGGGR